MGERRKLKLPVETLGKHGVRVKSLSALTAGAAVLLAAIGYSSALAKSDSVRVRVTPAGVSAGDSVSIRARVQPAGKVCSARIGPLGTSGRKLSAKKAVGGAVSWRAAVPDSATTGGWRARVTCAGAGTGTARFSVTALPPAPPPAPTPVAVDPGSYRGATVHGNSVFFDVLSNRAVRGWRANDIRDTCNGGSYTYGAFDLGTNTTPIDVQGNFAFQATFQTTLTSGDNGDTIPATEHFQVAGHIQGSIASGTVLDTFEFDYNGSHYSCSNNAEGWSANRLP